MEFSVIQDNIRDLYKVGIINNEKLLAMAHEAGCWLGCRDGSKVRRDIERKRPHSLVRVCTRNGAHNSGAKLRLCQAIRALHERSFAPSPKDEVTLLKETVARLEDRVAALEQKLAAIAAVIR